jgi:lipid A disaccharide synthetase
MVKVGYISIPNLLAGREIFPEFVQRLDPSLIAEEIFFMLENGGRRAELLAVKEKFRVDIDPYKASAEAIIEVLEEHYGPLS